MKPNHTPSAQNGQLAAPESILHFDSRFSMGGGHQKAIVTLIHLDSP